MRHVVVLLALAAGVVSPRAQAAGYHVCGPFVVQGAGSASGTFSCPRPVTPGPYRLLLHNGRPDGSGRASSARLSVNGSDQVTPSDFDAQVGGVSRVVPLSDANSISISANGSAVYLSAEIVDESAICLAAGPFTADAGGPALNAQFGKRNAFAQPELQAFANGAMASAAQIALNGAPLAQPHAFKDAVSAVLAPVTLAASNTLTASIPSRGAYLVQVIDRDEAAPVFSLAAPVDGSFTNVSPAAVSGSIDDPSATLTVNGVPGAIAGGLFTAAVALTPGWNDLAVQAVDPCRNSSAAQVRVGYDVTPPQIAIEAPADGSFSRAAQQEVVLSYGDDFSGVDPATLQVLLDGEDVTGASILDMTEGVHTLAASIRDRATNQGSASVSWIVDRTPPSVSISEPAQPLYGTRSIAFEAAFADALSGVDPSATQVFLNGLDVTAQLAADPTWARGVLQASEGQNELALSVADRAGNVSQQVVLFFVDTTPPLLDVAQPSDGLIVNRRDLSINGTASDDTGVAVTVNGTIAPMIGDSFQAQLTLRDGSNLVTVVATDAAGNMSTVTRIVTYAGTPPSWPTGATLTATATSTSSVMLTWTPATDTTGVTGYRLYQNGSLLQTASGSKLSATVDGLVLGVQATFQVQAGNSANLWSADGPITAYIAVPPEPKLIAPAVDPTVVTTLADSTAFLYTGPNAIQTGVAPGTIEPKRVSVVRGKVRDRVSQPLAGVRISVHGHPEYGVTWSRADGQYDLALNGGGPVVIDYDRADLLAAQRQLTPTWQEYTTLDDVVMIQPDQVTSLISSGVPATQVARGSVSIDSMGARQATVVFPPGTQATITLPDGSTRTLSSMHIRATEATVGADGPKSMPGPLPATSAYTYAVNFSADEAVQAGATHVQFSQPVYGYVENFLSFPVGMVVPSGTYDPPTARWLPEANGKVIAVVGVTDGAADVDTDGDGLPDDATTLAALGLSAAERVQLAQLYQPGQTLWRTPLVHFSWLDWNFPVGFGPGVRKPNPTRPDRSAFASCPDTKHGCIVEVQNQVLGERIALAGTPYELDYRSATVAGRRANYRLNLQVPAPFMQQMPQNVTVCMPGRTPLCQDGSGSTYRVDSTVTVSVAGRQFQTTSADAMIGAAGTWGFEWDGRDAYGRELQGEQPVSVRTCYAYPAVLYGDEGPFTQAWAQPSLSGAIIVARVGGQFSGLMDLCVDSSTRLGGWNAKAAGLGGWTLSSLHTLDVPNRTVYRGDGGIQRVEDLNRAVVNPIAGKYGIPYDQTLIAEGAPAIGTTMMPRGLAAGPDGTIYFSDAWRAAIGRITPDGRVHPIAGGIGGFVSDAEGVLAKDARVWTGPTGLALGADGTLYYQETGHGKIRKITPDGRVFTVAGNTGVGYTPDGVPAVSAALGLFGGRGGPAVGPDGTVYFAEYWNQRVRKVGPDGILRTVAGNGPVNMYPPWGRFSGDGGPALQAQLNGPEGVALGPDGSLYVVDGCNERIRKITPDGIIRTVAGSGGIFGYDCNLAPARYDGDGGPATAAGLYYPLFALAVGPDSTLYIGSAMNIRRVNPSGIIDVLAGDLHGGGPNQPGCHGADCPATARGLGEIEGLAVGPAGDVFAAVDNDLYQVVKVSPASTKQQLGVSDIVVPSPDASELYVFDSHGRHQRTLNALTKAPLQTFAYDTAGRVISVTDRDGNVTRIDRDAQENPSAIVGPYGQQTTLALDADGYLRSVANPNGEMVQLFYTPTVPGDAHSGGLLSRYVDARNGSSFYEYDADGFLTKDTRADGSWHAFARNGTLAPTTVTRTTALGRTEAYTVAQNANGDTETRTTTDMAGLRTTQTRRPDHTETLTQPDGTVITTADQPDPRFGMQSAFVGSTTVKLPSGLTLAESQTRSVTLANPQDPLSLQSLIEAVTVNGRTSRSSYDAVARRMTLTSAAGRVTTVNYDASGRVTQISPPGVQPMVLHYDARGRNDAVTQGARVTTLSYDAAGFLRSVVDPAQQTTSFASDPVGRPVRQTLPDLNAIGLGYDANGNVTSVAPPSRPAHAFAFTPADLESDYTPPGGASFNTHTEYDLDQQVSSVSRPDGDFISPTYDPVKGRLTALVTSRGTTRIGYSATTGQLTSVTTPDGVGLTYGYDGSLLKDITWSGPVSGNVHKTYDSSFRVVSESVTGGQTINFRYDNDDLLTSAGAMTITRDPATGFVAASDLGVVHEARTYDAYGADQHYTVTANGTTLYDVDYGTRDALGRIVSKTETVQGTTHVYGYTYDANGRLVDVSTDGNATSHYEYDANGNRLVGPGLIASPVYDNQDRLLSYGACTYTYNNDGSLQTKTCPEGTTTYDYDAFGNLRGVTLADGTSITYLIDGQNRRVGKKVNGTLVETFVYDDNLNRVGWYDGTGALKAQIVFGQVSYAPLVLIKAGLNYRVIVDQIGSIREVVAEDGSVAQRIDYNEFGEVSNDTSPGLQPFGFSSGLRDLDTGLTRFGRRDYDPIIGRWTRTDPIRFAGGLTNLFGYTGGDPINSSDPAGLYMMMGYCPNYQRALEVARKKAGCSAGSNGTGGGSSQCSAQCHLPCNICPMLTDGNWPPLYPVGAPAGSTANGATFCNLGLRDPACYVQALSRLCYDAANVDKLAQTLFHESLHTCIGSNPGDSIWRGILGDEAPISDDAKGITDACWK